MKVVHICLGNFYIDNYSYQENMLPKYHKKLGYDVEIIASLMSFDKNGKRSFLETEKVYENENGIKVTRLEYKKPQLIFKKLKRYVGTYKILKESKPDILFIHGCQFLDMSIIVKYLKKYPIEKVYVDNHADFSNSATNFLSKNILHKIFWKHTAQIIEPYTQKFFGVLPARVEFLQNIYKVPTNKCELLIMGANDELIEKYCNEKSRETFRNLLGIKKNDFVIVTGGKIDKSKKQTLFLMKAIRNMNATNIKLFIFGSIAVEIKKEFENLCCENIKYIGWANEEESYKNFSIADLVVFPGRHSVYWEQVVAMGIPMICKFWEGTTHVDIGGNVKFLNEDSEKEIKRNLEEIIYNPEVYENMCKNATKKEKNTFLYSYIAKKSIGEITND